MKEEPSPAKKIATDVSAYLAHAATDSKPVAIVYQLFGQKGQKVPCAADMPAMVQQVLDRAISASKKAPSRQNVFKNLGSFVVEADAALHQAIVDQPEIKAAVLNRSSG